MESNWRSNIADQGLVGIGISLAARLLDVPGVNNWYATDFKGPGAWIVVVPPNTAPDMPYGVMDGSKFAAHFPYGRLVEPD